MIKVIPSEFEFLAYYKFFADKTDLGRKIFVKAFKDTNKVDVVLLNNHTILKKEIVNVEVTSDFSFIADLDKFHGLLKARKQNVEVEIIPGLISLGKKSKSEFEIFPQRFQNYNELIEDHISEVNARVMKLQMDHDLLFKAFELASLVKPEEELDLVYLNRNFLLTTDRFTTVTYESDLYFDRVYGLNPPILKALKPYFSKNKEVPPIEITYINNPDEDKMLMHFTVEGVLTIFIPRYDLNMVDLFSIPAFTDASTETNYVSLDLEELINAISLVKLSSSYDGFIMEYKDEEMLIKSLDNDSFETIKLHQNTLRLNDYSKTYSASHIITILNSIKKKKVSQFVKIFDSGNQDILARFEAEDYDEIRYFRSKV